MSFNFERNADTFSLLVGITGSVASITLPELLIVLRRFAEQAKLPLDVRIVATECGLKFVDGWLDDLLKNERIYTDADEWSTWKHRGNPVLHIELRKWADALLIAPLDANSMAKIAGGICDNLLTSVVRAWEIGKKPVLYAPAMNTEMWNNPLTAYHRDTLRNILLFKEIPVVEKLLVCGDRGLGAMAGLETIAAEVELLLSAHAKTALHQA